MEMPAPVMAKIRARGWSAELIERIVQSSARPDQNENLASSTLNEAKIIIESWRRHYNAVRPHASLRYRAPAPEVIVPALAAWPAAQSRPAPPATLPLEPRPTMN